MKNIGFLLMSAALLLTLSCDKIDSDQYLIRGGAVGNWYDDLDGVADHSQRAFLEKYTGCRCMNCPTADDIINEALDTYGGTLIAVAVHPRSNYSIPFTGDPDLRTDDGTTWNDYYHFDSYPVAMLNRDGNDFVPTVNFNDKIDAIANNDATVAVAAECSRTPEGTLEITTHLEFLATVTTPLNLTLLMVEDGIKTTQKMPDKSENPDYIQNHVLRDVITDAWGVAVDADGKAGTRRYTTVSYEAAEGWNLDRCHIVALLSDRSGKAIVNSATCHIK